MMKEVQMDKTINSAYENLKHLASKESSEIPSNEIFEKIKFEKHNADDNPNPRKMKKIDSILQLSEEETKLEIEVNELESSYSQIKHVIPFSEEELQDCAIVITEIVFDTYKIGKELNDRSLEDVFIDNKDGIYIFEIDKRICDPEILEKIKYYRWKKIEYLNVMTYQDTYYEISIYFNMADTHRTKESYMLAFGRMKNKVSIEICLVNIGDNKNYICSCNSEFAEFKNMIMKPCEGKPNYWIIINGFNKTYKHYIHDWYNKYFPPWFLEYCVLYKEGVGSVEKSSGLDTSSKTNKKEKFNYQTSALKEWLEKNDRKILNLKERPLQAKGESSCKGCALVTAAIAMGLQINKDILNVLNLNLKWVTNELGMENPIQLDSQTLGTRFKEFFHQSKNAKMKKTPLRYKELHLMLVFDGFESESHYFYCNVRDECAQAFNSWNNETIFLNTLSFKKIYFLNGDQGISKKFRLRKAWKLGQNYLNF